MQSAAESKNENNVPPPKPVAKAPINFTFIETRGIERDIIMARYLAISDRFPHLNLREIISFERAVKAAGGSVMVHSGIFKLQSRMVSDHINQAHISYANFVGWTCCYTGKGHVGGTTYSRSWGKPIYFDGDEKMPRELYDRYNALSQCYLTYDSVRMHKVGGGPRVVDQSSFHWSNPIPDILKPNPIGVCDLPITFSI
jgi:hypothetical protein